MSQNGSSKEWELTPAVHYLFIFLIPPQKTVRLWHVRKRVCVLATKSEPLIGMSRALAFSPRKGDFIACGIGGRLANRRAGNFGKHAGKVVMLATRSLKTLATFKVAKEMVSDICFSRNGSILAVASNDNIIYLLAVNGPGARVRRRAPRWAGRAGQLLGVS